MFLILVYRFINSVEDLIIESITEACKTEERLETEHDPTKIEEIMMEFNLDCKGNVY